MPPSNVRAIGYAVLAGVAWFFVACAIQVARGDLRGDVTLGPAIGVVVGTFLGVVLAQYGRQPRGPQG